MHHIIRLGVMMAVVLTCLGLVSCDSADIDLPWSKTTMFGVVGNPKALSPEHVQAYYVGFPELEPGGRTEVSVNALMNEATVELFRVRLEGPVADLSDRPALILGEDVLYLHLADIDCLDTMVYDDGSGGLRLDRGNASNEAVFRYRMSAGRVDLLDTGEVSRVLCALADRDGLVLVGEDKRGRGVIGSWPETEGGLEALSRLDSAIGGPSPLRIQADATNGEVYFPAVDGVYRMDLTSGVVDKVVSRNLRRADLAATVRRPDGGIALIYEVVEPYDPDPVFRKGALHVEQYNAGFELVDSSSIPGLADYAVFGPSGALVSATVPNGNAGWAIDSRYVSFDGIEVRTLDPYLIDERVFDAYYSALYQGLTQDDFPHRISLDTVTLPVWSLSPGGDEYLMINPHSGEIIQRYRP